MVSYPRKSAGVMALYKKKWAEKESRRKIRERFSLKYTIRREAECEKNYGGK